MTKHTPGPWSVVAELVYGPNSELIAESLHRDNNPGANARLIAAAPELLEALELAYATIERLNRRDSANGTLDVLQDVIAQAKGE